MDMADKRCAVGHGLRVYVVVPISLLECAPARVAANRTPKPDQAVGNYLIIRILLMIHDTTR